MDNSKRHAYLILAHNNPGQLNKLIELLDHSRNDIYIHIDRKSSLDESDISYKFKYSDIYTYKEIKVFWADVSQVEVELFILEKAVERGPYQYYHLISGADLPIKSQEYILDFYDRNNGKEFVEYQIPGKFLSKPYYERIKYYHVLSKYYRSGGVIQNNIFVAIEYFCIFWQWLFRVNRIPKDMEWARGSNWFDITDSLAKYLISKRDWIMKQFQKTRSADESFLPLLVHNSEFKNHLYLQKFDGDMHANMRYIDWTRGEPHLWRIEDYDELVSSDLLFARKFDEKIDGQIIDRIYDFLKGDK